MVEQFHEAPGLSVIVIYFNADGSVRAHCSLESKSKEVLSCSSSSYTWCGTVFRFCICVLYKLSVLNVVSFLYFC